MRLFYVEDERLIRESVAKQIQKMFPLEVFTACHGEEGLELFKKYNGCTPRNFRKYKK